MKHLRIFYLCFVASLLFVSVGCVYSPSMWTRFEPFSPQRYAAKPESYVMPMSPGEPTNRSYEKIGVVWSSWYTYESAEEYVRQKAKDIGADAVIGLRYTTYEVTVNAGVGTFTASGYGNITTGTGSISSVGYSDGYPKVVGIAIRFTDNSNEEIKFTNPNIVDPRTKR